VGSRQCSSGEAESADSLSFAASALGFVCQRHNYALSESTGGEPLQHVPKGSRIFFPVRGRPRYRVKQAAPANRPARCFVSRSVRVIHFAPRDKPRVWNVRGSRLLYIPFGLADERANLRRFYGHVPKRLPSRLALREPRPTNHVSLLTNRVALRSSAARRSATAFSTVLRTRARTSAGARSGVPESKGGAAAYSRPNCTD
jgi:hypothetical protein